MKTQNVNLVFKIRGQYLVTYVTKINGKFFGIAEKVAVPKTKITLKSSLYQNIDAKTEYNCVISCDNDNINVLSLQKIEYPVNTKYIEDNSGKKIVCQIGKKRIYFDPNNGASKHSSTIDGAVRAIEMCNNNFDKLSVIEKVKNIYRTKFL